MRRGARRLVMILLVVTGVVTVVATVSASSLDQRGPSQSDGSGTGGQPDAEADAGSDAAEAGLEPLLRQQLDRAIAAAAAAGVDLRVTSGRRSWGEQERLYQAAIKKYGSARQASHWVLPPSESAHVRGDAVDVGPRAGAAWLQKHGPAFGLCRRYDNEWWHFELLAPATGGRCPARDPHA